MITYVAKEGYMSVKWKKTQIGRIKQDDEGSWLYYPRGGGVQAGFISLADVKRYLERETLLCPVFQNKQ